MTIVFIITRSDSIGGAQIHVKDLSLDLKQNGHSVTIIVGKKGPFTAMLKEVGLPFRQVASLNRSISPFSDFKAMQEIRRVLKEIDPDVITTHSAKAGFIGRLAGWTLNKKVIYTAHGWPFADGKSNLKKIFFVFLERAIAPISGTIITVSDHDRNLALKNKIGLRVPIMTIHNGVPDIQRNWYAKPSESPVKIIMVARLDEPKDHQFLILALSKLMDLEWTVDLVGDGTREAKLRKFIAEKKLSDRVNFLGYRNDIPSLLAKSNLFVLLSHWEGFPLSVLEAMRAGLPVIASNVGGVSEAIIDDTNGYLVERGDLGCLVHSLRKMISHPKIRSDMGAAGRKRYESNFTFESMADRTYDVYSTMISRT